MGYNWTLLSASANIPAADGVACCVHSNGNRFMFGGVYTSTMSGLYRSHENDPANWTFLGNLPIPPRHLANLVPHSDGRIYIRGGDHFNAASQTDMWSFDGTGSDLQPEDGTPGEPCIGAVNWPVGDFLYEYGGQSTLLAASGAPVTFYAHLRRWSRAAGWQVLLKNDTWAPLGSQPARQLPIGTRGFYSGSAQKGAKIWLAGGTEYETSGYVRDVKHDIVSIEIVNELPVVEVINVRPPFNGLSWPTLAHWKDNLWVMFGYDPMLGNGANGDIKSVWRSPDDGKTWIREPDFPGTKRHAAGRLVGADYIDTGTASHYGKDFYRLTKGTVSYGVTWNGGTTSFWGQRVTMVDLENNLEPGVRVSKLGLASIGPLAGIVPKVVRRVSQAVFDIVYTGAAFDHVGGSVYVDSNIDFTPPQDGYDYFVAFSAPWPSSPEAFCNGSYSKAHYFGDASGSGVTFVVAGDGTIPTRWAEWQ